MLLIISSQAPSVIPLTNLPRLLRLSGVLGKYLRRALTTTHLHTGTKMLSGRDKGVCKKWLSFLSGINLFLAFGVRDNLFYCLENEHRLKIDLESSTLLEVTPFASSFSNTLVETTFSPIPITLDTEASVLCLYLAPPGSIFYQTDSYVISALS